MTSFVRVRNAQGYTYREIVLGTLVVRRDHKALRFCGWSR